MGQRLSVLLDRFARWPVPKTTDTGTSTRRSAAMAMVGHKTESIYRRYAIVAEADLLAGGEDTRRSTTDSRS